MSYTNTTSHYSLPQYVAADVPSILSDVNTAYSNIDAAIYDVASAQSTVDTTVTALATRVTTAESEIDTLQTDLDTAETSIETNASAITTLNSTVSTLSSTVTSNTTNISTNASDIDDLQELVGSETLETTAQTVTGAINELASGGTSGITRTLLWSNDDPTSEFASQTITLSSDDYDELVIYFNIGTTLAYEKSARILKGSAGMLDMCYTASGGAMACRRILTYVSDTSYTVAAGVIATGTTAETQNNGYIIPTYIYGIKYSE